MGKREREREKLITDSKRNYIGPNYKRFKTEYDNASDRLSVEKAKINAEKIQHIKKINDKYGEKIKTVESDAQDDIASDNEIISSALKVLYSALKALFVESFKSPDYPKWMYVMSAFVLSIIMSIGLEGVIWASFKIFAIPPEWLVPKTPDETSISRLQLKIVQPVLSGVIFVCTFVIISTTFNRTIDITIPLILIFILTVSFSVFINRAMKRYHSSEETEDKETKIKETKINWDKTKALIYDTIVSTMTIAFMTFFANFLVIIITGGNSNISSISDFCIFLVSGCVAKMGANSIDT